MHGIDEDLAAAMTPMQIAHDLVQHSKRGLLASGGTLRRGR
jgi:hypothetical protein